MNRTRSLATLVALPLLVGCSPREVVHHLVGGTMGTTYSIKIVALEDAPVVTRAAERVEEVLDEVNQRFSTWIDGSTISRFNAHRSTAPFEADEEFIAVLAAALHVAEWTGGAYDPTILPLARAYGFGPGGEHHRPDAEELAVARSAVGWTKLELLGPTRVRKLDPSVEVDLNSIAKGTGVDRVSRALRELGLADHMVEIGGEVYCAGRKPGDVPWQIGIESVESGLGDPVREVVPLEDRALATSGDYRNWFEAGDRRIHHVLDPRTGESTANDVVQVSVLADTCTMADCLATACMVIGPDDTRTLLERDELDDVEVRFVMRGADGNAVAVRVPERH